MVLREDICRYLTGTGVEYMTDSTGGLDIIRIGDTQAVFPIEISAASMDEASRQADALRKAVECHIEATGTYPLIITEDRWRSRPEMMQSRLLAHLNIFTQIYARNCEIRKIDKHMAASFLESCHSYADASCRYRYGLFLKRHTGHNAGSCPLEPGCLVAVATFSNARKWTKGDKVIRSYEWTRYASLPDVRLSGGMGKLLKAFIQEVRPDDIMTYADLEWSQGKVYKRLGFVLEGFKEPVTFVIDKDRWTRLPIRSGMAGKTGDVTDCLAEDVIAGLTEDVIAGLTGNLLFQNLGSNKYRLKLTDYQ